jgi:hypothetical protein
MSISLGSLFGDLVTWGGAAKVVLGGALHKIGSYLYKLYTEAKAEAAKLEADAKADIKKL